ncbi:phosphoethanolamine transferase [Photobacterium swingsii]|uniref:phosphoethanolamine transferase n=1 Tax=Photobacterium swingsii TaxID=680026 RepID=UPI00406938A5
MKKTYFFGLILISLLPYFHLISTTGSSNLGHGTPLINIILITLCCSCKSNFVSNILKGFVSILLFIQLNSVLYYNSFLTYGAFSSIMETNSNEAYGFLSEFGYFWIFVSLLISSIFFFISSKITINIKIKYKVLLLIILLFIHPIRWAVSGSKSFGEFVSEPYIKINDLYYYTLLNPIFNFATYKDEQRLLLAPDNYNLPSHITDNGKDSEYNKVYVIIGESAYRNHLSAYGYNIETTPYIDSLSNDPKFNLVHNTISPTPITRESLKRNLSFSTVEDKTGYNKYINIVNAAKEKGFNTHWLSSQTNQGIHSSLIGRIGQSSDISIFNNSNDETLIDLVNKNYRSEAKQLFILHLAGSHLPYNNFSDGDLDNAIKMGSKTPEYDATILKTDRVIKSVIEKSFEDKKSLVIYFSDHGEEVNVGHGLPEMSPEQYEIPFFIYDSQKNNNLEQIEAMRANNLFNTERVMEFMMSKFGYDLDVSQLSTTQPTVLDVKNKVQNYNYDKRNHI